MTLAPTAGVGKEPQRDAADEPAALDEQSRTETGDESEPTREEKERLDRDAGDVADDLADFA